MRETEIDRGGRVLRVRDAGDPGGAEVMYFHGTPSSRLDLCFGEQLAAEYGVRLVSFDRPGYGGSTPASFGLASIAADAHAIADELGIARFATLGLSGGGPGALAAAAVPGGRVTQVGIASGECARSSPRADADVYCAALVGEEPLCWSMPESGFGCRRAEGDSAWPGRPGFESEPGITAPA